MRRHSRLAASRTIEMLSRRLMAMRGDAPRNKQIYFDTRLRRIARTKRIRNRFSVNKKSAYFLPHKFPREKSHWKRAEIHSKRQWKYNQSVSRGFDRNRRMWILNPCKWMFHSIRVSLYQNVEYNLLSGRVYFISQASYSFLFFLDFHRLISIQNQLFISKIH